MGDLGKDIESKFVNQRMKALINIKYTANWLESIENECLKPYRISIQQYNILRILRGAKQAIAVNSLKSRMIQKSPNSTRLMDKLVHKNLIERIRSDEDKRVVHLKITNIGLELLEKIKIQEFNRVMRTLNEEEAKILNKLLDKIR